MPTVLSKDDLQQLAGTIAEAEKACSGEIRVVVRHKRQWNEKRLSLHDLALKEFRALGMEKTRDRTGVLILLLLSERKFQIIADEGIHAKVGGQTWEQLAAGLSGQFRDGKFLQGLQRTVMDVGSILARHFPCRPDDTNELPNDVIER